MNGARPRPFVRRPAGRGYGYDANGWRGWVFTLGFMVITGATAIAAGLLLEHGHRVLGFAGIALAFAEALGFALFARREAERS